MKRLTATLLLFIVLSIAMGCTLKPQRDVMLTWFDATAYMQELVDYCYGDGYVNYMTGDPGYCPRYDEADLIPKFEVIMEGLGLTFVRYVGSNHVSTAIDELRVDYTSGVEDEETLARINYIEFPTCIALDMEGNEKAVYLPSYVPKGFDVTAYVYDQVFGVTYAELQAMASEYADACVERNIISSTDGAAFDAKVCLNDVLFTSVILTRDPAFMTNELHYVAMIDTYMRSGETWIPVDNNVHHQLQVRIRSTESGIDIYYDTWSLDEFGMPVHDLIFSLPLR